MKVDDLINEIIKDEIIDNYGYNCFLSRKYIIKDRIKELEPGKPEDQTSGFIAFNVPNKDRMKLKTNRFLTRKLNLNSGFLSDKVICKITDKINNELFGNDGIIIELVRGEEITKHYERETGSHSCMTGDCADYTQLYEINPDRFQMLVMFYQNDSARAIVSKLDDGSFYMDRIYSSCGFLQNKMIEYAENQNWPCYDKNRDTEDMTISNLDYEDGHIPYMDTFRNGCICYDGLTISTCGCCDYDLGNTDGYLSGGHTCEFCGGHLTEDDCYYTDDHCLCQDCYDENYSCCDNCGKIEHRDNISCIKDTHKYVCEDCRDRKYVCCEDCEGYFENDYIIDVDGYIHCNDCADGKYYPCEYCGEIYPIDDLVDNYCESCKPDDETEKIICENYPEQLEINYEQSNS